jgi:hypothetical protein
MRVQAHSWGLGADRAGTGGNAQLVKREHIFPLGSSGILWYLVESVRITEGYMPHATP